MSGSRRLEMQCSTRKNNSKMPRKNSPKRLSLAIPGAINRLTEKDTQNTRNGDGGIHKREIVRDGKHR